MPSALAGRLWRIPASLLSPFNSGVRIRGMADNSASLVELPRRLLRSLGNANQERHWFVRRLQRANCP